ncbi:MAG: adenylate kinase [Deltaproteobacteria bacterium]|jgi:adenylate kinase|nr:adenylate kinase [Deltaproteobacteria bacterium]
MIIILLGPPGAGKGTQAAALVKRFEVPHVSTGDIFRANLASGTPLGLEAKGYMDRGALVPDELTVRMVGERLRLPDASAGCLLDGFPRTAAQAEALEELLTTLGRQVDVCLQLDVPNDELVTRLSGRRVCRGCGAGWHVSYAPPPADFVCPHCGGSIGQRADDAEAAIKNRLQVYHEQTSPVASWYAAKGRLKTVPGLGSPSDVEAALAQAMS